MNERGKTVNGSVINRVVLLWLLLTSAILARAQSNDKQSNNIIHVGVANAPPIIIIEPDKPPQGMMIDFLEKVASMENWQIKWVVNEWPVIDQMIRDGQIDLITFMAYSDERARFMDFSNESFVTEWGQVYTQNKQTYQSILDFDEKSVAVMKGEIHGSGFIELCKLFEITCHFEVVESYQAAFSLLSSGEVDGLASSNIVGYVYESKFDVHRTGIMYHPQKTLFAIPKNHDAQVLTILDRYLTEWRLSSDSYYHEIHDKWINRMEKSDWPRWLVYLAAISVLLLLLSWLVVVFLRKQIRKHVGEISDQKDQISQIINLVPHMIYAVNEKGQVILANDNTENFFGVGQLNEKHVDDMQNNKAGSEPLFRDDQFLLSDRARSFNKEITVINEQDGEAIFKVTKVPYFGKTSQLPSIVTVAIDVTEEKLHEQQMEHMVQHDLLTGLSNRVFLNERIKQSHLHAVKKKQHGAVLFIDLDHFKKVNDTLGHRIGDELLKRVAKTLNSIVVPENTVARIGSDEFVVQIDDPSADMPSAEKAIYPVAEQITEMLGTPCEIEGNILYVSASVGVVIYPNTEVSHKQILQRADTAMRFAKYKGRNQYAVFKENMEREIKRQHVIEEALRSAIKNSEFILQFQPQIDATEDKLIGVEALLRWQHPSGDLVQPNDFIGVAEQSGLIVPLGFWVIEEACKQIKKWSQEHQEPPFITVNLSVAQVLNLDFVDAVKAMLEKYQINPTLLELEVTESVMLEDASVAIEVLNQLKSLGVKLSIDDFGTGFSSLNYLKKLPFDKLKIDRSFINDIPGDQDNENIIKSIITISTDMGLELIAEGVETKEQVDLLMNLNCDHFQGFFYDRPSNIEYIDKKYL